MNHTTRSLGARGVVSRRSETALLQIAFQSGGLAKYKQEIQLRRVCKTLVEKDALGERLHAGESIMIPVTLVAKSHGERGARDSHYERLRRYPIKSLISLAWKRGHSTPCSRIASYIRGPWFQRVEAMEVALKPSPRE